MSLRFVCCHLRSAPYGPYLFKDNPERPPEELATLVDQQGQGNDMQVILDTIVNSPACEPLLPTVLVGDLNIPSHLDWIPPVLTKRGFGRPVLWPVSSRLLQNGFVDAFRAHHRDPILNLGYTWPSKPADQTGFESIDDRIDFIFVRSADTILAAQENHLSAQFGPSALGRHFHEQRAKTAEHFGCAQPHLSTAHQRVAMPTLSSLLAVPNSPSLSSESSSSIFSPSSVPVSRPSSPPIPPTLSLSASVPVRSLSSVGASAIAYDRLDQKVAEDREAAAVTAITASACHVNIDCCDLVTRVTPHTLAATPSPTQWPSDHFLISAQLSLVAGANPLEN